MRTQRSKGSRHVEAADEVAQVRAALAESDREQVADLLRGQMWRFSRDQTGCRLVQEALGLVPLKVARELAAELRGHVAEAIRSPHGNFVIQRIIEVFPADAISFVVEEIRAIGAVAVARDRFGCRVLCRLLEHSMENPRAAELLGEVVAQAGSLFLDAFAHFVLEAVLEHGLEEHQHYVVQVLLRDVPSLSASRSAAFVIEKALRYAAEEDRRALAGLICGPHLRALVGSGPGCHLIRAAVQEMESGCRPDGVDMSMVVEHVLHLAKEHPSKHTAALIEAIEPEVHQFGVAFLSA